jgi:peptidoglycan-associated lipoprotein
MNDQKVVPSIMIPKAKMKKILTAVSLMVCLSVLGLTTKAQYTLKQADGQYNLFNYSKAVDLYLKAYKKTPTYYIAEHIANCYHLLRDYPNQETWYATAISIDGTKPDNILKYANALKNNEKYKEAKAEFTRYYILSRPTDTAHRNFYTTACDSAVKWLADSAHIERFEIKNEYILNSPKSDWGAVKTNGSTVFTSDRGEIIEKDAKKPFLRFDNVNRGPDKKVYEWTDNGYLRLYKMDDNGKSADVLQLFPVDAETEYHIGAATFTANGNEMYFTVTRLPKKWLKDTAKIKTINLEIYSTRRSGAKWASPVSFKYNNAAKFSNDDPFITPDGKTLYFVSDRPGGMGGTDIYTCTRNNGGNWSEPVNLKAINTFGNERTPVTDPHNNLYFSSDGYKGMGGLDIFKATRVGNTYAPQKINLAYPINSAQDDFAYTVLTDSTGYFSSNRFGGQGSDDIYSYTIKPASCYRLDGVVYQTGTQIPIANATVTLAKVKGKAIKVRTDETGAFTFCLDKKSAYALRGEKVGYLVDNETVSTIGLEPGTAIKKDLYLDKIELNKAIRLKNIYYDLDKSFIRPDAAKELNKLIKIMKDNPTLIIEIGSHTDSRANDDYNMALSQRRAKAAVDYITSVGDIDEDRIVAHGYGETRLLNRCANGVKCSEEEHQLNRRTEFTILKY